MEAFGNNTQQTKEAMKDSTLPCIKFFNHDQVHELMPMSKCISIMETMFQMLASNNILKTTTTTVESLAQVSAHDSHNQFFEFPVRTVLPVPKQFLVNHPLQQQMAVLGYMPSFANLQSVPTTASLSTDIASLPYQQFISTKVITVYAPSPIETHLGVVLLFEAVHGQLLAIFDAKAVTAIRTAACSAVAAKHLARLNKIGHEQLKIVLIGSGVQARMHSLALAHVFSSAFNTISITIVSRDECKQKKCVNDIEKMLKESNINNISVSSDTSIQNACKDAHIICTLTSSAIPVLKRDWVSTNSLIIAVGACKPNMRELDSDIIKDSILVVDKLDSALKEAGDILIPINEGVIDSNHIYSELADVVANKKFIPDDGKPIVFKSLGMAIEDLMTSVQIYASSELPHSNSRSLYTTIDMGSGVVESAVDDVNADIHPFPQLKHIQNAQKTIKDVCSKTPLVPLNAGAELSHIHLKLENLQFIGSYKVRPAANMLLNLMENPDTFKKIKNSGIVTCSAGNFAQGLAYICDKYDVPCTIVVPSHAPEAKRSAILRINHKARIVDVGMDEWWNMMVNERVSENDEQFFASPVTNPFAIAGNGTIGLEILEQLPPSVPLDKLAVIVPYGGGAMTIGVCTALKTINENIQVYACEVETAAPLKASLDAGEPTQVDYTPSFVDGIGSKGVFPSNFYKLKNMIDGSLVVSVKETAQACKLLMERNHVIAEGAGGAAVAAAIKYSSTILKDKTVVAIISGGNIDSSKLIRILSGDNME